MSPHLILVGRQGERFALRVPAPDGLVPMPSPHRSDYVLAMVHPDRAAVIYDFLEVGMSPKVALRLQEMMEDATAGVEVQPRCEVPVALVSDSGAVRVTSDAWVLSALIGAGVPWVPILVHRDEVGKLVNR